MAFLKPDKVIKAKVGKETITINQKIIPDNARATKRICSYIEKGDLVKPNRKLGTNGKPKGITVHNTDTIRVPSGTNPAEQYARATYPNGNMGGVVVHYWVCGTNIWQQLEDSEQGWHAADGQTRRSSHRSGQTLGGNRDTISIECIETGTDKTSEATTAKLVAYLLDKHGLSPKYDVYTHNYFYSKKYCPAYILPHWNSFMSNVTSYYNAIQQAKKPTVTTPTKPTTVTHKQGEAVKLSNAPLYASASATKASNHVSGTYYLYDGKSFSGRYRVTVRKDYCGKTPIYKYVTGYIKL